MEWPTGMTTRRLIALLPIVGWIGYCYLFDERSDDGQIGSSSPIGGHPLGGVRESRPPERYDERFWREVRRSATAERLYSPETDVSRTLTALRSAKIARVRLFTPDHIPKSEEFDDFGSTHKWLIDLEGGQKAVFKPKWYARNHSKQFWSDGFEIHTSEIVSHHVDRLLGFHRVPYTTGRYINISSEVLPHSTNHMAEVLSYNGKDYCLKDKCYFCEDDLVTCTRNDQLEGAMIYFIANLSRPIDNPWGVKYSHRHLSKGFNNRTYCQQIVSRNHYLQKESTFLDLVDLSVLDHLTYHFDSKLYWIREGRSRGLMVYLDRGRSFTRSDDDDDRNLLPLWQCCRVRRSTWMTILFLNKDDNLATGLKRLLVWDALYPPSLLADEHYDAMTKRLRHILSVIERCVAANGGASDVIVDSYDGKRKLAF